MPVGEHIFLSYRSLERAFALTLAAALRNAGVRTWVDCLPEGILPGDDWPKTLEEALNNCRALVAAISPGYAASRVCRQELHRAIRLGRPVFPVLIQSVVPEEWPLQIESLQYVDFTNWNDQSRFQKACDALVSRLESDVTEVVGQRPDTERQFLLTMTADLESKGCLSRYVSLIADLLKGEECASRRLKGMSATGKWGLDQEFLVFETSSPNGLNRERQERRSRRLASVLDMIAVPRKFVLLGEPGSGKTTTLRRLALEAARSRLAGTSQAPLPLLLSLPQWVSEPDPVSFVRSQWPFETDVTLAISTGQVILLFDGLNEMGRDGPIKSKQLKEWLASAHGPQRFVATCRKRDYAGQLDLGLDEVILQEMDDAHIQLFSAAYLQDAATGFLECVLTPNTSPRSLRSLARNPYLLTCLMVLYEDTGQSLPRNLGLVFHRLAQFLWSREFKRQTRGWLPFDETQARLADLAFAMIEEDCPTSVPRSYVLNRLDIAGLGEGLLNAARSATILESDGNEIRFSHQLMQEYFAAVRFGQVDVDTRIKQQEFRTGDRFSPGYWGPIAGKWDEVVMAACGLNSDADQLISAIAQKNVFLAARCALTAESMHRDTVVKVTRELLTLYDFNLKEAESLKAQEPECDITHWYDQNHDAWESLFVKYDGISRYASDILSSIVGTHGQVFEDLAASMNPAEAAYAKRVLDLVACRNTAHT